MRISHPIVVVIPARFRGLRKHKQGRYSDRNSRHLHFRLTPKFCTHYDFLLFPPPETKAPPNREVMAGPNQIEDVRHSIYGAIHTALICITRYPMMGPMRQILAPLSHTKQCGAVAIIVNLLEVR